MSRAVSAASCDGVGGDLLRRLYVQESNPRSVDASGERQTVRPSVHSKNCCNVDSSKLTLFSTGDLTGEFGGDWDGECGNVLSNPKGSPRLVLSWSHRNPVGTVACEYDVFFG